MILENPPRHATRRLRALRRSPGRDRRDLLPRLEKLEERSLLSYTIADLGTLGGPVSWANGLNDNGQVVGESDTGAVDKYGHPIDHAFLWDGTQGMRDLGTPTGDLNSDAGKINGAGEVAGSSSTAPVLKVDKKTGYSYFVWTDHSATWSSTLKAQELGVGGAYGINGSGEIVGTSNNDPILWSGGKPIDLGTLGGAGNPSWASAINDSGQVVGSAPLNDSSQTQRAFLWTPTTPDGTKGSMKNLGALDTTPGQFSSGFAINALGEVVGVSDVLSLPHSFLYQGGKMYDLGTFGGVYNGSQALSINASGVVTGTAFDESSSFVAQRAWIWIPTSSNGTSGQLTDLNTLIPANSGWILNKATTINDVGQIVGGGTINGVEHAFLLTPSTMASVQSVSLTASGMAVGRSIPISGRLVLLHRPAASTIAAIGTLDTDWWANSALDTEPVPIPGTYHALDLALTDLAGASHHRR